MNKFEVVLLLNPELGSQNLKKQINSFKSQISTKSGTIINEEDWGLRDLSYNIDKFKKAFYNFFQIEMDSSNIASIKKDLNLSEDLLRYIFIKVKKHQELPTKLKNEKK